MKFAIDIRGIDDRPAGKEQYVLNILKGLAKIDKHNTFLLLSDQPVRLPFALPKNFKRRIERGFGPWWHVRISQLLEEEGICCYLSGLSYLVPVLTDCPTLLVVYDLAIFTHPKTASAKTRIVERWALLRAVRKAKTVVAISKSTKEELLRLVKIDHLQVIQPGLEAEFRPVSGRTRLRVVKKYALPSHFLLFVGTLEPRKNVPTLVEAYWLLSKQRRRRYQLVIVGKKGWKYEEIFSTIGQLGLSGSVRHLEYVERSDLPTIYSLASVFIYPSLAEGFGLPVLEAMSCGLPVIVSNTTALPEVVGRAGLLVPPDDPKAISQAIERLLTDPVLRRKLGRLGRSQAAQFSWPRAALAIHRLLLEIGTTDLQHRSRTPACRQAGRTRGKSIFSQF